MTDTTPSKLLKKKFWTYKLTCKTGLHIGGNQDSTEIGGVDNPVIRRRSDGQPYIPGSSIKGKMRSLLQQIHGEWTFENTGSDAYVAPLFGCLKNEKDANLLGHASHLIVRDAYLTKKSASDIETNYKTDMPYTEQKQENSIDRVLGTVNERSGVRSQERVPQGAEFKVEFVMNVFEGDDEAKMVQTFKTGIQLLNRDYLGGSGSRGYGHIELKESSPHYEITREAFIKGEIPEEKQ